MKSQEKKSLPEQVCAYLERAIMQGQYSIGQKIPVETELMKMYGVSRNSVREAVQALIQAGVLEAKQGSGTFVRAKSRLHAEMQELYALSSEEEWQESGDVFGKFILKAATKRRSAENIKELEECLKNLKDACKQCIFEQENKNAFMQRKEQFFILQECGFKFVQILAQSSQNSLLGMLYSQWENVSFQKLQNIEAWQAKIKCFEQVTFAIKERDSKALKKIMKP